MKRSRWPGTTEPRVQRGMLRTSMAVIATLGCLLCIIFIAAQSTSDANVERVWFASYRAATLAQVIADLEEARALPRGTTWTNPALRQRRVTVSWLAVSGREAIGDLEQLAGVDISYEHGDHGELRGPITIGLPVPVHGQLGLDMSWASPPPLPAIFSVLILLFVAPVGAYVLRRRIAEAEGVWFVGGRLLQGLALINAPIAVLAAVGWALSSH